jgi:hypothetical protein
MRVTCSNPLELVEEILWQAWQAGGTHGLATWVTREQVAAAALRRAQRRVLAMAGDIVVGEVLGRRIDLCFSIQPRKVRLADVVPMAAWAKQYPEVKLLVAASQEAIVTRNTPRPWTPKDAFIKRATNTTAALA